MLSALMFALVLQSEPPIGDIVRNLPEPIPVSIGPAQSWSIREVPKPRPRGIEIADSLKGVTVKVGGRKVSIRPTDRYEHVDAVSRGGDGSLLISRGHRDVRWSGADSIWYRGEESEVPGGISIYRDRLNYAAATVDDVNALGMPLSAPKSFYVEHGKRHELGFGTVRFWGGGGLFALDVPVDERLRPSGYEFTTGTLLRIVSPNYHASFPGCDFLGREADGTIVMVTGIGDGSAGNAFKYANKRASAVTLVIRWREGSVLSVWELPPSWTVVGRSPAGWLLARKVRPLKNAFENLKPGTSMKEMQAMMAADNDTGEQDWSMGFLRGVRLTPLRFTRPPGTEKLLWRNGDEEYGGATALRIHVFRGNIDRWFRLSLPARRSMSRVDW
ncbi:MAG TPA: hypothetical protein VG944_09755 [Fimbriimonas sp.]|nr:hypothetical protein [Fimbriimonas sp.]